MNTFLRRTVLFSLLLATVLEAQPYLSQQFSKEEIEIHENLQYGEKQDQGGRTTPLLVDIFQPPSATKEAPQPLIIIIHGGGFFTGTKEKRREWAYDYAMHGYVAACINYRLSPKELRDASPEGFVTAATHATEDGMDAIRYLKITAARFGIDPNRIATLGESAGGWISGFNALEFDTFKNTINHYPGTSSRVQAAIATGVSYADDTLHKKMRDELIGFDSDDTPMILFHAEAVDRVTTAPWSEAVHLQKLIRNSGNTCELYKQPGNKHVDDMSPSGPYWHRIAPFLKTHLNL